MTTTVISALDLLIMLKAALDSHMSRTLVETEMSPEELMGALNPLIRLPRKVVESGLYYANMAGEEGTFWHPAGLSSDEWLGDRFKSFNRKYNYVD